MTTLSPKPESTNQELLEHRIEGMNAMHDTFFAPLGINNPILRSGYTKYLENSPHIGFMSAEVESGLGVVGIFTMAGPGGQKDITNVGQDGANLICAEIDLLNLLETEGVEEVVVFSDLRNLRMSGSNVGLVRQAMRLNSLPTRAKQVVLINSSAVAPVARSLISMVPGLNAGLETNEAAAIEVLRKSLKLES